MAIKNTCPKCQKGFSAPASYLGKRIECPRCGHRVVLRSAEEIARDENAEAERLQRLDEDQQRLALIERMEIRRRRTSRPYYEAFGTGASPVRNFNSGAPSRFLRFRALSELLTFAAYVELLLVLLGMGLTIFLKVEGTIPSMPLLLVCLVAWGILGTSLYLGLKFLGELAFLLSDLGDQQNDVVQLLLDVRENTDIPVEEQRQRE